LCLKVDLNCPLVLRPWATAKKVVFVANTKPNQMSSLTCNIFHALHVFHGTVAHEHLLHRLVQWTGNGIETIWNVGTAERTIAALAHETCEALSTENMRTWELHRLTEKL
jgi:hypothetical protein